MTETGPAVVADLNGFVLIDKPSGLTSQQVVSRAKRFLGVRKAGHAGTLDPQATGLMIVGVGRGTRLLGYLSGHDKRYQATIRLGQATTTDDAAGEAIGAAVDASGLATAEIVAAMARFTGQIDQVPSAVSAVKVAGRRAYALVRAGEEVELAARTVTVTRFDLDDRRDQAPWCDLAVTVDCSSGTYIRALARDLGQALGVGGHVTSLRRITIAALDVADAVVLEDLSREHVHDLGEMAALIAPCVEVTDPQARDLAHGRTIDLPLDALTAVFAGGALISLCRPDPDQPGRARPCTVFVDSADVSSPDLESEI